MDMAENMIKMDIVVDMCMAEVITKADMVADTGMVADILAELVADTGMTADMVADTSIAADMGMVFIHPVHEKFFSGSIGKPFDMVLGDGGIFGKRNRR